MRETVYAQFLRAGPYSRHVERTASLLDGELSITELRQGAGAYPDPPLACFNFQLLLEGRGAVRLDLDGVRWAGAARPGQVFVAAPRAPTDYRVGFHHRLVAVSVADRLMGELCQQAGLAPPSHRARPCEEGAAPGLLEALRALVLANGPAGCRPSDGAARSILTSLAWALSRGQTPADAPDLDEAALARAKRFALNAAEPGIGVAEIAAFLETDRFRLARATKRLAGLSPARLLRQWRIERALSLITDTTLPLAEVAARAGFSDQAHMGRVIRQATGRTPGALRTGA
ncbi:MAG: AraC family transcriptional regulator [Pseudomonadota bacterium]